jgi:hypothetical protein
LVRSEELPSERTRSEVRGERRSDGGDEVRGGGGSPVRAREREKRGRERERRKKLVPVQFYH